MNKVINKFATGYDLGTTFLDVTKNGDHLVFKLFVFNIIQNLSQVVKEIF